VTGQSVHGRNQFNPTWQRRIATATLVDGSHYHLLLSGGAELRYRDPRPDATRVEVIAVDGVLVEEARVPTISCSSQRCGTRYRPAPPGRSWTLADDTGPSYTVWRRRPPWLRHARRTA
jgi:hypothetical protein